MTPLRRRMLEDMQLRNLGTETQRAYLFYITGLARLPNISAWKRSANTNCT